MANNTTEFGNTVFWNVDTQYDFMRSDGKLYVQGAEAIEGNLERLTKLAKERNVRVVSTADWHTMASEEIASGTFPPHCMQDTPGAEYVPATRPEKPVYFQWNTFGVEPRQIFGEREIVILKDKYDVFEGNPHASKILGFLSVSRAIVYGVATNVCVHAAVKGLLERGKEVYVVKDAIKELPKEVPVPTLETVLNEWEKAGAKMITTDEVERYI